MPLFIKRGHKVYGPFSVAQIKSGVENKEIAAADYISKSKDGPWHNFAKLLANPESLMEPGEQTASQSPQPAATPSKRNTVACEDCGGIVSLRATTCPHCGCPQVNLPQYFIKRNETVTGPFNINQINAGTQSQTLKASDLVGISENGPWAPLSDYHQKTSGNASIVTSIPVTAVPLVTPSPLVSDPPASDGAPKRSKHHDTTSFSIATKLGNILPA